MRTQNPLRLGFIGTGHMARIHMKTFQQIPNVEMTAVTGVQLNKARQCAKEFGIQHVFQNARDLLQSTEVDAVIISVPNDFHASIAIQAIQAGKHVLLEKPMAIHAHEAEQILQVKQQHPIIFMISHQMRWSWPAIESKKRIELGQLGRIYYGKAGWLRRKGIPGWGTWFTKKEHSGGGPLIDIGVHMLDLAMYLMGNPTPVSVYGATYAEFGPKKRGIGDWGVPDWDGYFDVEDLAVAFIQMEDGSTLTLEVSWAIHMETTNTPYIHLAGTNGGISIQGEQAILFYEENDQALHQELHPPELHLNEHQLMCHHFIECILENIEPITNVYTGYKNSLILDAIYESAITGHEIRLQDRS